MSKTLKDDDAHQIRVDAVAILPAHDDPADDIDIAEEKNAATAENGGLKRPTIQRRLNRRHITFIGFGGGIGIGLFIGAGAALAKGGPLSLLLSFAIAGLMIWSYIQSLGEIFTLYPSAGSLPYFAARFIDPAAGFALGWNYWYTFSLTFAAELVASALLISYWSPLNPAIWITIAGIPCIILNLLPVKHWGNVEICTASIKVLTFIVLIIVGLVIDLGGAPDHDRRGFRYWNDPGAMNTFPGISNDHTARFAALFACFVNACFAYGGSETDKSAFGRGRVGADDILILTAAECTNPTKQIPRAAKRVIYRILFFYIVGSLIIGMTVPYNDERLLGGTGNAASSPFVIGMERAGIKILPHIINACILTSAWSAGNTYIWLSSRALLGLSLSGAAPKVFARCTKYGVPYVAVAATSSFGALAYLCSAPGGSTQAFIWLNNLVALSGLLSIATMCIAYIRFHKALKVQAIDRASLPWHGPFQPYAAYFAIAFCGIITFFSGFAVFLDGNWSTADFFAAYVSYLIYGVPYIGYKLWKKTKVVHLQDIDLKSGRLRPEDEVPEPVATTVWGKAVDWLL